MTDQGKPTTEDMLSLLLSMHEYQSSPLTPLGEMQYEAILARLSEYDRLAQGLDALKADVCSALGAYENEGPRLAALRVMEEKQKAEAALAEQKPLVEAVMASDLKANGPAAREPGKAWCSGQSLKAILQAALAYREKQDKKEGKNG